MDIFEALLWLTLNVYHEARSEDRLGQVAVAHVTINRAKESGDSIKDVVLKPKQFSWTHQQTDFYPYDYEAFFECLESVIIAANGYDFTKGSTYYHKKNIKPYWSKDMIMVTQIGKHKFYMEN